MYNKGISNNKHMAIKIVGAALLISGVLGIGFGLYSSWQIFANLKEPPMIFKVDNPIVLPTPQSQTPEQMAQNLIQEQFAKMLPEGGLTKILNLIAWSVFAGILFLGFGKIAQIGSSLIVKAPKREIREGQTL